MASVKLTLAELSDVCAVLAEVKNLPEHDSVSMPLWTKVMNAHAVLRSRIDWALADIKVEVAIERGPQIASDMHARLPGSAS